MNTIHRLHAVLVVVLLLAIIGLGVYSLITSYNLITAVVGSAVLVYMLVYILYYMFY